MDTADTGKRAESRLPSLTGMRFLAALFVLGFHLEISGLFRPSAAQSTLSRVFGEGALGVSFFFVLSGFVLAWSARPGDTRARFWRRRWAKVYPNHLVTWVVALAGLLATGHAVSLLEAGSNLFLLQSWWPDQNIYFGVNTVSWSLSCEAFFYLVFPWLLGPLLRVRTSRLWGCAGLCAAAVLVVPAVAGLLPGQLPYWFVFVCPPVRCLEFVLGMVMARIVREGRWIPLGLWPATALVAVAYAVAPYFPVNAQPVAVTVIPFALLIPAAAAADTRGLPSPWRSRTVLWLGETSFALYLVHQLVIRYLLKGLHAQGWSPVKGGAVAVLVLALSIAFAGLLHARVEVPMMRRLGRPRSPARHRSKDDGRAREPVAGQLAGSGLPGLPDGADPRADQPYTS